MVLERKFTFLSTQGGKHKLPLQKRQCWVKPSPCKAQSDQFPSGYVPHLFALQSDQNRWLGKSQQDLQPHVTSLLADLEIVQQQRLYPRELGQTISVVFCFLCSFSTTGKLCLVLPLHNKTCWNKGPGTSKDTRVATGKTTHIYCSVVAEVHSSFPWLQQGIGFVILQTFKHSYLI